MTNNRAKRLAAKLGMSVWRGRRIREDNDGTLHRLKCVGFASADFPMACAEYWEDAFERAAGIVFSV